MHLPPRTCPVRRISGDLRSSDPRGDLRPTLLPCVVLRVLGLGHGWSFFPLAMSVAEACPAVSWQHAIHGGISVFRDTSSGFKDKEGKKHHPPSKPAPSSRSLAAPKTSVQVEKPLPGPSVSTRHAVGY